MQKQIRKWKNKMNCSLHPLDWLRCIRMVCILRSREKQGTNQQMVEQIVCSRNKPWIQHRRQYCTFHTQRKTNKWQEKVNEKQMFCACKMLCIVFVRLWWIQRMPFISWHFWSQLDRIKKTNEKYDKIMQVFLQQNSEIWLEMTHWNALNSIQGGKEIVEKKYNQIRFVLKDMLIATKSVKRDFLVMDKHEKVLHLNEVVWIRSVNEGRRTVEKNLEESKRMWQKSSL